jgi:hypothetical protein
MPGFCFETFKSCLGEFLLSSGCFAEASSNASGLNHSIHGRRIPTAGALSSSLVLVTGDAHSGTKCRWLAYRAMVLRDDNITPATRQDTADARATEDGLTYARAAEALQAWISQSAWRGCRKMARAGGDAGKWPAPTSATLDQVEASHARRARGEELHLLGVSADSLRAVRREQRRVTPRVSLTTNEECLAATTPDSGKQFTIEVGTVLAE